MTVRAALGAGRWRLLHQTAIESLLLAVTGGLIGFALAYWCVPAVIHMLPERYPLPRRGEIAVDATVLWFTIGASILCGLFFGIFPALQLDRTCLSDGLKQGGRTGSGTGRGLRNLLVVGEVAVAVVLVTGAGLMLRSFALLSQTDAGFRPEHLLTVRMMLIFNKYASDLPRRAAVVQETLERIRRLPQVRSASSIHILPMNGGNSGTGYHRADRPAPAPGTGTGGAVSVISDDYFRTMGIRMIAGREFDRRTERFGAPGAAILNRAAARMLFQDEDPIGKRLKVAWGGATDPEVVGISEDIRHDNLNTEPEPTLFVCNMQAPSLFASFVVRTYGDPIQAVSAVRQAIRETDPDQGAAEIRSMEQLIAGSIAGPRLQALLLGVFGGLGMALACIGIYAVISYSTVQRTREMGIRLALGAAPGKIRRLVMGEGLLLAGVGITMGVLIALGLTRYMKTLLYAVTPTDPHVYATVCLMLFLAAIAGCWLPARRATAVEPGLLLREE